MTTDTTVMAIGNSQKYPRHTNIWAWTFFLLSENWPVQVVDYVGVFVFPHHQDLIDDQLFLGLLLQVHLLDGHLRRKNEKMGEWKHDRARRLGEREWMSLCMRFLQPAALTSWPVAMSMAVYTVPDALVEHVIKIILDTHGHVEF